MFKEFKEFAARGNVMDMAVGIVVGTAFGAIARSLVDDVIMPPIGLLLGDVDFSSLMLVLSSGTPGPPYATSAEAAEAGAVTLNYGLFINSVLIFLIVAFAMFLVVRSINRMHKKEEAAPPPPSDKSCPFCKSTIHVEATRCPNCTSDLATA